MGPSPEPQMLSPPGCHSPRCLSEAGGLDCEGLIRTLGRTGLLAGRLLAGRLLGAAARGVAARGVAAHRVAAPERGADSRGRLGHRGPEQRFSHRALLAEAPGPGGSGPHPAEGEVTRGAREHAGFPSHPERKQFCYFFFF